MTYFDRALDGEPFPDTASRLSFELDAALPALRSIAESEASTPRAPGKWSRKEILGHLVDSAANNHQRFVRAQSGSPLRLPGYAQVDWVASQRYDGRRWEEIIGLWVAYNRHLVHVIAQIPEGVRGVSCQIGDDPPVTLGFIVLDYVGHLQHHLRQITDRGAP